MPAPSSSAPGPITSKSAHVATAAASPTASPTEAGNPPPAASADGWSKLIDAETIETEIKRLSQELAKTVTAPAQFKGGGYKDCRRQFSVLAALFAVAAEYDGEVRWKDAAPRLRDVFAKAGHNCKVGTDQTFQEAVQRKQDLADLDRRQSAETIRRRTSKPTGPRSPIARR